MFKVSLNSVEYKLRYCMFQGKCMGKVGSGQVQDQNQGSALADQYAKFKGIEKLLKV